MKKSLKTLAVAVAATLFVPLVSQATFLIDHMDSPVGGVHLIAGGASVDSGSPNIGGARYAELVSVTGNGGNLDINYTTTTDLYWLHTNNGSTATSMLAYGTDGSGAIDNSLDVNLTPTNENSFGFLWTSTDQPTTVTLTVQDTDGSNYSAPGIVTPTLVNTDQWQYVPFLNFTTVNAAGGTAGIDWTHIAYVSFQQVASNENTDAYLHQIVTINPVPEPTTAGLLLFGLVGLLRRRRR